MGRDEIFSFHNIVAPLEKTEEGARQEETGFLKSHHRHAKEDAGLVA